MKKYKWNLYELQNNLKLLKEINQQSDEKDHEFIQDLITNYEDMIRVSCNKEIDSSHHFIDDQMNYSEFSTFIERQIDFYQNNDFSIFNLLLQSFVPFKEKFFSHPDLNPIPICLTNEELMVIAMDFVKKMVPLPIQTQILSVLEQKNIFQFSNFKKINGYSGLTLIDPILFKKYILAVRSNQLLDIRIIPHEIFHYVFNDYDICSIETNNMYYTTEIEGNFADFLFSDYYYHNALENQNYFQLYNLEFYHDLISRLVVYYTFCDALTLQKHFRINKFNKALTYYQLEPFQNTQEIMNYLDDPLDIDMKYALGFLCGIDLYFIYQKDPELAFYLLKNIRLIKQDNDILSVFRKNHLTFMDDGYANLKEYVKKIKKDSLL